MNADGRTALHTACCEGDIKVVLCLLKMGANIHIKDRFDRTPLTDAIEYDRHKVKKNCILNCLFSQNSTIVILQILKESQIFISDRRSKFLTFSKSLISLHKYFIFVHIHHLPIVRSPHYSYFVKNLDSFHSSR